MLFWLPLNSVDIFRDWCRISLNFCYITVSKFYLILYNLSLCLLILFSHCFLTICFERALDLLSAILRIGSGTLWKLLSFLHHPVSWQQACLNWCVYNQLVVPWFLLEEIFLLGFMDRFENLPDNKHPDRKQRWHRRGNLYCKVTFLGWQ